MPTDKAVPTAALATTEINPPISTSFAMPAPPAVMMDPLEVEVELFEAETVKTPAEFVVAPMKTSPAIPAPPPVIKAPVMVEVDAVVGVRVRDVVPRVATEVIPQ